MEPNTTSVEIYYSLLHAIGSGPQNRVFGSYSVPVLSSGPQVSNCSHRCSFLLYSPYSAMAAATVKGFEGFEPQFAEATAEWDEDKGTASEEAIGTDLHRRPFLFHVHAVDPHLLEIVASNFRSHTFQRRLTVEDLEDLRDDTGIGGSWSDFVDYLSKSLSSGGVKLFFDGATTAKLIARMSKGMPRITFLLNQLTASSSNDAIANLSLALYIAYKDKHNEAMKERDHHLQLTKLLSFEKEKNEGLQKQLDAYTFKSKRKIAKPNASDKALFVSDKPSNVDMELDPEAQPPSDISSSKVSPSMKASHCVVTARRAKTRGALLQDTENDDGI